VSVQGNQNEDHFISLNYVVVAARAGLLLRRESDGDPGSFGDLFGREIGAVDGCRGVWDMRG
jgi:hypothetical protein